MSRNQIIYFCIFSLQLSLFLIPGKAKNLWLELSEQDPRPLAEALLEVERHYLVFFTYDTDLIANTEVDFQVKESESIEEAIDRLLSQTDLTYDTFGDKYFVLYRSDRKGLKSARKLKRKIKQIEKIENKGQISLQRSSKERRKQLEQIANAAKILERGPVISGTVTSTTGEPLIGVNLIIEGADQGTSTDLDGKFRLGLPKTDDKQLVLVSYIGYQSQEIYVEKSQDLNIKLKPGNNALKQVVVIGYGEQQKGAATGSWQSSQDHEFAPNTGASPEQLLLGRIAGLNILPSSGEPGAVSSVRLRGATSINASNEPLYVIDGLPIDNQAVIPEGFKRGRSPLSAIAPQDIESITVLKDAAATAIYGARAANGVILIQTKRPKGKSDLKVNYQSWVSIANAQNQVPVMDASVFREVTQQVAPNRLDELGTANTDWQGAVLQTAISHQHSLSLAQSTNQQGYRWSLSYFDQEGILKGSNLQRLSSSLNFQRDIIPNKLKVNSHIKLAYLRDNFSAEEILVNAVRFDPSQPILSDNDQWGGFFEYENDLAFKNPVAIVELQDDRAKSYRALGDIQLSWRDFLFEGLKAKLNLGYDRSQGTRTRFSPSILRSQSDDNGEIRIAEHTRENWLWESYLEYERRIGNGHLIKAIGGYSYQHFQNQFPQTRAWDLSTDIYGASDLSVAEEVIFRNDGAENKIISFFGRLNYDFQNRYQVSLSLRRDGSSRFGLSNRWGHFPAAAVAWKISDEKFWSSLRPLVDHLKLRLSWGLTGNQEIGDYRFLNTYTTGDRFVRYQFGDEFITTIRPNGVDPNLKWEQTESWNLGLDFQLFSGKITASLDLYRQETQDLLSEVFVSAGTNLTDVVLTNIGGMENSGIELALQTDLIHKNKFQWSVNMTMAANRNRVTKLSVFDNQNLVGINTGRITGGVGNTIQIIQEGQPLYAFYVYEHKRDEQGRPLVDGIDHNGDGIIDLADMFADTNEDGKVDINDRRAYQQPEAKIHLGLQSYWQWNQFDASISFRAQLGNYVYNNIAADLSHSNRIATDFVPSNLLANYGETPFEKAPYFSDYFVENAAFLKLDFLSIGYRFRQPGKRESIRFFATAQNLLTISSYSGLDPEVGNISGNANDPRFGIDDNYYPRARTLLLGLEAHF